MRYSPGCDNGACHSLSSEVQAGVSASASAREHGLGWEETTDQGEAKMHPWRCRGLRLGWAVQQV